MKDEEKKENCGIDSIELPNKICQSSCKVCLSEHLKEIHLLRKNGSKFSEIVSIMKKKGKSFSEGSLCRHFQNYNKITTAVTAEILEKDLVDEAMKRSVHSSAVIGLIDTYLELLKNRLDNGLIANVSDFEKLMNIRYKLLSGEKEDDKDLTLKFQQAMKIYNIESSDQPSLFNSNEPEVIEVSKNETEAE